MRLPRWIVPGLLATALLMAAGASVRAQGDGARPVDGVAATGPGFLKRSDVLLSPRSYRKDWKEAYEAFHANRIVWTYDGPRYIAEVGARGIRVQCTVPFWVPKSAPDAAEMACVDPKGKAHTIQFHDGSSLTFPDVHTTAWRSQQLKSLKALVDQGCRHFQQDDPALNLSRAYVGGCHSPEARSVRSKWMIGRTRPAGDDRTMTHDAEKNGMAEYHKWLHQEVRSYVAARHTGEQVTFSGNIGSHQIQRHRWLIGSFDFLISEIYAPPGRLMDDLKYFAAEVSNSPHVNAVTIVSSDKVLIRRAIASAYALGLVPLIPWDAYVSTKEPRFFGKPQDFAALFGLVRANARVFDMYSQPVPADRSGVKASQAFVTAVDTATFPDRVTIRWSGQGKDVQIAKNAAIEIGGRKFFAIAESKTGNIYLPRSAKVVEGEPIEFSQIGYQIEVRRTADQGQRKAIHAVNWSADRPLVLHVDKQLFGPAPQTLLTSDDPKPRRIEPVSLGRQWIYSVGEVKTWAILY